MMTCKDVNQHWSMHFIWAYEVASAMSMDKRLAILHSMRILEHCHPCLLS